MRLRRTTPTLSRLVLRIIPICARRIIQFCPHRFVHGTTFRHGGQRSQSADAGGWPRTKRAPVLAQPLPYVSVKYNVAACRGRSAWARRRNGVPDVGKKFWRRVGCAEAATREGDGCDGRRPDAQRLKPTLPLRIPRSSVRSCLAERLLPCSCPFRCPTAAPNQLSELPQQQ